MIAECGCLTFDPRVLHVYRYMIDEEWELPKSSALPPCPVSIG